MEPPYRIDGPVIFLDVDGVIATPKQIHAYAQTHGGSCPPGFAQIDMECMKRLREIVIKTNAHVVISSSWRKICHDMFDLVKAFSEFSIPLIGLTPSLPSGNRGDEIVTFCKDHRIKMSDILVLDDDEADLVKVKDRHIRTDGYYGLSEDDVFKSVHMLQSSDPH